MKCQACQQKPATVHLTEIVQKSKRETHLCEECARDKGVSFTHSFSVKEYLGGLSKDEAEDEPAVPPAPAASPEAPPERFPPCPSCGLTYEQFRQTGRFGCAEDYTHFRAALMPLLEKIHGKRSHTGRVPDRIGERLEHQRRLAQLQQALEAAVEAENYERAAELRDAIATLAEGSEQRA